MQAERKWHFWCCRALFVLVAVVGVGVVLLGVVVSVVVVLFAVLFRK